MGWWKVQNTDHVVGDVPLDALTAAVKQVVQEYQSELGRLPTKEEWQALLNAVLGAEEPEARIVEGESIVRVLVE